MKGREGPWGGGGTFLKYPWVMVGPPPGQEPHPPVWMPVGSPGSASEAASRGITIGVLNTGWVRTPAIYEAYRKTAAEAGREMRLAKLAYTAPIGVSDTPAEGFPRATPVL